MTHGFQLIERGPQAYERYLVPAYFAPSADQLLDLAAVRPGERVLDVACGTGIVARRAAARVGAAGTVVGVDVSAEMLAVASSATPHTDAVDWHEGDAIALPLPDGTFDVVCCQQGLQFFSDQRLALREAYRVLAPGGRIAVAVWRAIEHCPVFALLVKALDRYADAEAVRAMRAPFAGPDRDDLVRLLLDAGFARGTTRIGVLTARFPSPGDFLTRQVASSPLAGPVGALDASRRDALFDHLDRSLAQYVDDAGLVLPMQTWLVTARR